MTIDATGSEDAWQRQCLIEVSDGTSVMTLMAEVETINIEGGEREKDKIDLVNLGQIPKHGGLAPFTVTFEGYPLYGGSAAAGAIDGFWEIYANKPVADGSQPLDTDLSNVLTKYRVSILWTNDPAASTGSGTTAASTDSSRFVIAECFATGCPIDFTDKIRKQTLSFWGLGFDKTGAAAGGNNVKMDDGKATALTALGNYTPGATKWA